METWILVALVLLHAIDRVFTMLSTRTREVEVSERAEKATAALAQAWEANARLQKAIEDRDVMLAALLAKPIAKARTRPDVATRREPAVNGFEGLRGPR